MIRLVDTAGRDRRERARGSVGTVRNRTPSICHDQALCTKLFEKAFGKGLKRAVRADCIMVFFVKKNSFAAWLQDVRSACYQGKCRDY